MSVAIDLSGKVAIVTGGGDGIGKACALMQAKAGATVFIADINEDNAKAVVEEIKSTYGTPASYCKCNVSSKADVDAMVDACVKEFGTVDILNHVAGVSKAVHFMELDEEMYDRIFDINVKGTYLVDQAVLRVMIPKKCGKIVNMSSMSGKVGYPTNVAYSASKFAVMGFTQAISKAMAPYNINVNAVCPGIVMTAIWENFLKDMKARGDDVDAYWEQRMSAIPLHRPQTPEDIAHMVVYLSSPFADNMTGQGINITGGLITN
ncbi:MAG: SDR family NAD(P)-dependent oxidoreductase [Eubacteriales bacterium]|jgi:meso-butanediol dehydrogenase/(S,S)-butanediol dehydrogenase/diacetyl reductase